MNEQRFDPDWAVDLAGLDTLESTLFPGPRVPTPNDYALARFIKRRRRKLGPTIGATGAIPKGGKRKRSRR